VLTNNGSHVTFTCEAFSYVSANLTWLQDGNLLNESPTINITTNNNAHVYTTTLTMLNVQLPDDGDYVCRATNREGEVLSKAATLTVIGKFITYPDFKLNAYCKNCQYFHWEFKKIK